jgi:hypothetical protein
MSQSKTYSGKKAKIQHERMPPKTWKMLTPEERAGIMNARATRVVAPTQGRPKGKQRAKQKLQRSKSLSSVQKSYTPGQLATNVQTATPGTGSLALTNQQQAIPYSVPLEGLPLIALSAGYITKAVERGAFASSQNPWDPFFAFQYMISILLQFATGSAPAVQKLPLWLLTFGRALMPKEGNFQRGKVKYTFVNLNTVPATPTTISMGYYAYHWHLLAVDEMATPINGFPVADATGWPSYTAGAGQAAFAEMNTYMANNEGDPFTAELNKLVDLSEKTSCDRDTSVFTVQTLNQGCGWDNQGAGGWAYLAYSECAVTRPWLTMFNDTYPTLFTNGGRFYNKPIRFAGDPCFLGASLSSLIGIRDWSSRFAPNFKAIDFLQFGDVLAQWIVSVVQAYINDPANDVTALNIDNIICQLTLQDMLILLRAVFMSAFKDTQAGVQALIPFTPSSGSDNQFVSYVASSTTCCLASIDMYLPMGLIENIRALVARSVRVGRHVMWWIPVLGQYKTDTLSDTNYTVTYNNAGTPTTVSVFQSGADLYRQQTMTKGGLVEMKVTETPINLVDGNASGTYVAINDQAQLETLVSYWDDWLATEGLQSYSMALGTFGTEKGISALCSIGMTRHWANLPTTESERLPKPLKVEDIRKRNVKYRRMLATIYAGRNAIADTSQMQILAPPYEQVMKTWILPVDKIQISEASGTVQSAFVTRMQGLSGERCLANFSTGSDGIILAVQNGNFASKMTKSKLQDKNDWSIFFEEMEKQGRGGLLSSIVNGIVSLFENA